LKSYQKRWQNFKINKNGEALLLHGGIAGIGFMNFILLAKLLSSDELGEWITFIAASSFLEVTRTGWVTYPLIRLATGLADEERLLLRKACSALGLLISVLTASLLMLLSIFFEKKIENSVFRLCSDYLPFFIIASFPVYDAIWEGQAKQNFKRILFLRLLTFGSFCFWLFFHYSKQQPINTNSIAFTYILLHAFPSVLAYIFKWSTLQVWQGFSSPYFHQALREGKYSMGSMLNLSLLKASDTFLIGYFAGNSAVALYGVPLKFTEVADIIQRSFSANAFPELATLQTQYLDKWQKITGYLVLFFVGIGIVCFLGADIILRYTAGEFYVNPQTKAVWYILLLWQVILPLERMSGVWLETWVSVRLNYKRTFLMLFINILLDIFVLKFTGDWVNVAWVSVGVATIGYVFVLIKNPFKR